MITKLDAHKAMVKGLFRVAAFFILAVAIVLIDDRKISQAALLLLVAIDIASQTAIQTTAMVGDHVYGRQWHDTLTNRFFYERLIEAFRSRDHIDVPELIRSATDDARKDLKLFHEQEAASALLGGVSHWAIVVWTFVWQWLRFAMFYGAAIAVGTVLKG